MVSPRPPTARLSVHSRASHLRTTHTPPPPPLPLPPFPPRGSKSRLELVFLKHLQHQNSWPRIVIDDEPDSGLEEMLCAGQASVHVALGVRLRNRASVDAAVNWLHHAPLVERHRWVAAVQEQLFADWGATRSSVDHLLHHLLGTHPGGDDRAARNERRVAFTEYINKLLKPAEDLATGTSQTDSAKRQRAEKSVSRLVVQLDDLHRRCDATPALILASPATTLLRSLMPCIAQRHVWEVQLDEVHILDHAGAHEHVAQAGNHQL